VDRNVAYLAAAAVSKISNNTPITKGSMWDTQREHRHRTGLRRYKCIKLALSRGSALLPRMRRGGTNHDLIALPRRVVDALIMIRRNLSR
jgi:hypothetical protein